jgi:hypothetical protein
VLHSIAGIQGFIDVRPAFHRAQNPEIILSKLDRQSSSASGVPENPRRGHKHPSFLHLAHARPSPRPSRTPPGAYLRARLPMPTKCSLCHRYTAHLIPLLPHPSQTPRTPHIPDLPTSPPVVLIWPGSKMRSHVTFAHPTYILFRTTRIHRFPIGCLESDVDVPRGPSRTLLFCDQENVRNAGWVSETDEALARAEFPVVEVGSGLDRRVV